MLAIIGGSGLNRLPNLEASRREPVLTPYGEPSAPLTFGRMRGREVVFLARHGDDNAIAPHEINYCANIWALHARGAKDAVAVASVGGIRADLVPGTLLVPDQIIDYTYGRRHTFGARGSGGVRHIDFTRPYCEGLRRRLLEAARAAGVAVLDGGTYAATQGPRLETAAEIDRLERDGAHVVGMTGMPEAALAREIGLCYAAIAVVVNEAAGRGASASEVRLAQAAAVGERAVQRVQAVIEELVARDGG
jgi:5'-methylthioadenosine phosphorylase